MTNEQIEVFKDCGEAQMPIEEACIIAECTEEDFSACKKAVDAYRSGQLLTKLKIRQSVIKMAKDGVPSMVKIYLERYDDEVMNMEEEDADIEDEA